MSEQTQQQLADFNTKPGFIIILKNDAQETQLIYDGQFLFYGNRYPPNDPENSGVSLSQRGDHPIYHYFTSRGYWVNGAIRYRIFLDQTGTSLYLYVGFRNEAEGNHGFYVSIKGKSSDSELRMAAHEAKEDGSEDHPYLGRWMAHVDYENYRNSNKVQQIRVTFSKTETTTKQKKMKR